MMMSFVDEVGRVTLFLRTLLRYLKQGKFRSRDIFNQIWKVTTDGIGVTLLAGFFVGAIMTIQFTMQIQEFGALGFLGGLSTSATIREVGPLLIAFLLSGKIGAFTSAELGVMRVTEQIDAIRCLGADPIQEIIVPRFIGIVISSFFLLAVGLFSSIFGGLTLAKFFTGINADEYLRHVPTIVDWSSIVSGLFKCGVFAVILALICTYKGYTTSGGAKGVGRSVVSTAVITMISIVIFDWFTSYLGSVAVVLYLGYRL